MADAVTVRVQAARGAYDVVTTDRLAGLGAAVAALGLGRSPMVITDDVVAPLWADAVEGELAAAGMDCRRLVVPSGEVRKTHETWWAMVDGLVRAGVDRRTPVVALGGGVVGDLAGFAAAVTLRGLPVVQVPTTLLAMVDSSVGGKTAFNHPSGKNLVGVFHAPRLVWAATETLGTLDDRVRRAGLGEVVKAAALGDAELLAFVEAHASALAVGDARATREAVARSVRVKADVVADDEREQGRRAVLNLGHTVAHGVETVAGFGVWHHGEAVSMGMVAEARWAERAGHVRAPGLADRLALVLTRLRLPTTLPRLDRDAMVAAMGLDKKARGAMLTVPVLASVGDPVLVTLPLDEVGALLGDPP